MEMAGRKEGQTDTVKEEGSDATLESTAAPTSWQKLPSADPVSATAPPSDAKGQSGPPAFVLEMTVSSGTYVRSIVHDLAKAAVSAAHVQKLTRIRQGEWSIGIPASVRSSSRDAPHATLENDEMAITGNCIEWKVFADAIAEMRKEKVDPAWNAERDEEGLRSWERELLRTIIPV
jgi:tRNA pseudouridine55 synthase